MVGVRFLLKFLNMYSFLRVVGRVVLMSCMEFVIIFVSGVGEEFGDK